jgi:predicted transposase YbfD/YdcC
LEERIYRVIEIPDILKKQHDWSGLKSLVEVISCREIKGVCSQEKRYYITSLSKDAIKIGKAIRSHWSIENNLHWVLDISFRDDESRIREGNAPENICIIKHMALNLLQRAKSKGKERFYQTAQKGCWMGQQDPTPCPFSNLNEAALEPPLESIYRNSSMMVNYGKRWRSGKRALTRFVGSTKSFQESEK